MICHCLSLTDDYYRDVHPLQIFITPPKCYSLPVVWAGSWYTSPKWGNSAHRSQQCSLEQAHTASAQPSMEGTESCHLKIIRVATATVTVGLTALTLGHKAVLTGSDCSHFLEWLWKWRISSLADRTISKCPTWEGGRQWIHMFGNLFSVLLIWSWCFVIMYNWCDFLIHFFQINTFYFPSFTETEEKSCEPVVKIDTSLLSNQDETGTVLIRRTCTCSIFSNWLPYFYMKITNIKKD